MKSSLSVSRIVIWALAGFIFSSVVLLYPYIIKEGSPFHEIRIDFQTAYNSVLTKRLVLLYNMQSDLKDSISKLRCGNNEITKNFPCSELQEKEKKIIEAINKTKKESIKYLSLNTDTLSNEFLNYISFNRADLSDSLTSKNLGAVHLYLHDTLSLLEPGSSPVTIYPEVIPASSSFSFFNKYPTFAFWFVLSVIQAVLWFMIIGFISSANDDKPGIENTSTSKIIILLKNFLLPFIAVALFTAILYWVMIDRYSISDQYFLSSFNTRMIFYAIPGYTAAVGCFGVYLITAKQLEAEDKKIQENNTETTAYFDKLEKKFKTAFFLSVITLSLFVFWIGVLLSGINSMDAMKMYSFIYKEPFIRYDFVYLISLLHSLLLAIFYIPAQLKFNSFRTVKQKTLDDNSKSWGNIIKNIAAVLIPATPLLTGLIQGLIDSFFK